MTYLNRVFVLIFISCLSFSAIHAQPYPDKVLVQEQVDLIMLLRNKQFRSLPRLIKGNPNLDVNFHYYDVDVKDAYNSKYGIDFSGQGAKDLMVTPLHKAALFSPAATSALLKIGADPNAGTETSGYTPLHLVVLANQNKSYLKASIKASAEILAAHNTTDLFKRAAFIVDGKSQKFSAPALADFERKKNLYNTIMTSYHSRLTASAQDETLNSRNALANAIEHNQPDKVDQILQDDQSIDVNAPLNLDGETFLHKAILKDPRITKALLEKGANPNAQMTLTGYTPLHLAALARLEWERTKASEVVKELLKDARTNMDIKGMAGPFSQNLTPTELADKEKNLPVVSLLRLAKVQKPSSLKRPASELVAPEAKKLKS